MFCIQKHEAEQRSLQQSFLRSRHCPQTPGGLSIILHEQSRRFPTSALPAGWQSAPATAARLSTQPPLPGCREQAEEAAGVDITLPALTRGHCCLAKAIKAPMLLSPRLKAAPQANTWTSLHSCQLLGPITHPQLATVA